MNLRKYAKGKQCQIRLPGCSLNPEETVLCHVRTSSTGIGQKEHDLLGAHGCQSCHNIVDRRDSPPYGWTYTDVRKTFLEAVIRTQKLLIEEGIIK